MALVIDHTKQEFASWRPGNTTRLNVGAPNGSTRLAMGEQWFEPGTGAPTHTHGDVEEIIVVIEGTAEFHVDEERVVVGPQSSVVLPPFSYHGFTNIGDCTLYLMGAWSSASVPTTYAEEPQATYEIGGSDGERADAARTVQR